MTKELFGRNIRAIRERKGITQQELSIAMGYSVTFICKVENGKKFVSPECIDALCVSLDCLPFELFMVNTGRAKTQRQISKELDAFISSYR
jgi:transcriptional regulator with XRE-family HTH domain